MACKYIYKGTTYTKEQFESFVKEEFVKRSPENKFLSLLEKDSNWVTFFIKSIIFDSAKKGYEKVLFPTGNTASKVEGHTTLEEFKKQKEDRIKELEKPIEFEVKREIGTSQYRVYKKGTNTSQSEGLTEEEANKRLLNLQEESKTWNIKEITTLKQELERVDREGFGALKPIYNFYENTVTNILKKQGYNPKLTTDEYGNTWNEISINQARDLSSIQFQKLTAEEKAKTIEQVTKEHRSIAALKDLAAKLAHRIGGKVKFENHPNADWKGYNQGMESVLNEAYMTPDTPFHEVLAHPIIRAIKTRPNYYKIGETAEFHGYGEPYRVTIEKIYDDTLEADIIDEKGSKQKVDLFELSKTQNTLLYQSLLKELETGRGKEVFEQVKRDYKYKDAGYTPQEQEIAKKIIETYKKLGKQPSEKELRIAENKRLEYTLEEQQEEAIVTLLGMMAADKLDAKKDATLISKLKELWKQISDFVKSLLKQDGIKIDELPITTTLNDLAEIMAYGNNKIILPGYKVEYSTPLGNKYDTLEEVNNEIRSLADANAEVDLSNIDLSQGNQQVPENLKWEVDNQGKSFKELIKNKQWKIYDGTGNTLIVANQLYNGNKGLFAWDGESYIHVDNITDKVTKIPFSEFLDLFSKIHQFGANKDKLFQDKIVEISEWDKKRINPLLEFLEKNKEYEQSREIIEQWKKENNIQYDPEEVYSRGQGFYSSIGAYSNLELDLLLKNLIQHIQDNKKASEQEKFHLYRVQEKGFNINENTLQSLENKVKRGETLKWFQANFLNDPEKRAMLESRDKHYGQWFADTVDGLQYYLDDKEDVEILRIEVSKKDLKQFNVGNSNSEDAKKWSLRHHDEYIIPKEIIAKAEKFERSDLEKLKKEHLTENNYGFTISAFTKPIDKRLKHIEGTGDRVRFVIYPKSEHIKWAAPTDVFSGSVWDAHEKVSKDKKSELLGVSFTKAPSLRNINEVSPNLADIIDNLSHAHNEAGLELTLSNFEIEYDENIDYSTKQIINSVNRLLQQKRLQEIDNFINTLEKQC